MTDSFWTKVLWSRFIKHFRKLTDEQIIKDIHESMDALEDNDESGDSFGAKMVAWANERRNEKAAVASRENGNLGGRPGKNPQDAPNGNAGEDGKSATSCDQFTADGDTREGSLDGKSGTSANNYGPRQAKNGDAPHREAGDESATVSGNNKGRSPDVEGSARYPGSAGERPKNLGSAVSTHTISTEGPRLAENAQAEAGAPSCGGSAANSYAHDALDSLDDKGEQSAKTRDSRGSGRYQPPSLGPEDGNLHDQETASGNYQVPDKVSTDGKGGCGPLEKPNSQKSPQPSLFPVATPEKRRYGKYRHVLLTDEEGRKLRESLGEDLEDAVAILDEYIQSLPVKAKGAKKNGAKWWMQEYEAKDHYIVLHHGWARKRLNEMRTDELNAKAAELRYSAAETNAKAAEKRLENANSSSQPRQMYLTSDDISRRNAEEGWRQLQLMHQMEGNG